MKVGVIGGGQLAQMLALAGYPLGIKVICVEATQDCPAALVTDVIVGAYENTEKLAELVQQVDVLTYEFENISLASISTLQNINLYPPLNALSIAKDRLLEKRFFQQTSVPTTHYLAVNSRNELQQAAAEIGLPAVLKTRSFGYDGKGQYVIQTAAEIATAWEKLQGTALILENWVKFDCEVSCIAARSLSGEILFYPLVKNQHKDGILRISEVTAFNPQVTNLAQSYVRRMLNELNYVGILAVEFFLEGEQLFANEMAPRVHNSGHWTIEGAQISQFENHLRAVCGLPLGSTATRGKVAMFNLISSVPPLDEILKISGAHCHLYGKTARPGRKLGHVTLCTEDEQIYHEELTALDTCLENYS